MPLPAEPLVVAGRLLSSQHPVATLVCRSLQGRSRRPCECLGAALPERSTLLGLPCSRRQAALVSSLAPSLLTVEPLVSRLLWAPRAVSQLGSLSAECCCSGS